MPSEAIKVVARFRPRNVIEAMKNDNPKEMVFLDDDQKTVECIEGDTPKRKAYTLDLIFPTNTNQMQMFELIGTTPVDNVLDGYNSTLFAYGQTGAGKTFSLVGKLDNPELFGIIPRAGQYLFEKLDLPCYTSSVVKMTACEVYMDKLKDILRPSKKDLLIRQTRKGVTYIEGIHEEYVTNIQEMFGLMNLGFSNRTTAATGMNAESSRSHCIFSLEIKTTTDEGSVKEGRLYFIDLAGSERVSKTGATGILLEEAKAINSSLTALGNVIGQLSKQDKKGKKAHVPFRDSTLTHLLKDSLSGNTKTCLLVCATMDDWNLEETISTLRFASRAKLLKNKVKAKRSVSPGKMLTVIGKQRDILIEACELCHSMLACNFQINMCETPVHDILDVLKKMLKDDFPEAEDFGDMNSAAHAAAEAAAAKAAEEAAKAAAAKAAEDDEVEDFDDDEIESVESEEEEEDEKIDEVEQAKLDEITRLRKLVQESKMIIMGCHNQTIDLDINIKKMQKSAAFYKNELAKHPKVPPPPSAEELARIAREKQEREDNKMDMIAKYKRDLRVYKYTLDLTRVEWKKNQTLALKKMNAHRKVIAKYKGDKTMLLSIVQDLESKVAEANRRLRLGQQQQREANALLGYAAPVDGMKSLDKHAANALAGFIKTAGPTSGNPSRMISGSSSSGLSQ